MVMRTLFGRERAYEMILSKYCATSATCSPWKSMGKPLLITIAHHPHFFSTSSDSFRYLRHAPGLQWQPVRMWMFCLAESVWIS